ncbi:DUF4268 domain-containing protein [Aquisalimonas lutea]|uniref:DUF4268 domain-containing protein n=1 Tax=Aquisalimonas lutea TaxID=1327750 RepID=UPI0025B469E6|nr:DUF4268 domain-containing protein [Aquisalimonas lutea]MDN3519624.1 DUF4268 domain-containing protein [Aquisalimonas lutea]
MFKIDTTSNRITSLEQRRFADLGFSERYHLQEWLENTPEAFGEELLIIQKEFDGFDDTRERLDLLALDTSGNLVVIENKLDDSGRDVVWQGLKYASYCANLSRHQIVEIHQRYLNARGAEEENAAEKIAEFLGVEDLAEAEINGSRSQRLIFVAANYRKEVTNTVLWLIQFGIQCQCFKATPYQSGDELFLNIEQIIPPPESEDFMIGMARKEEEKQSAKQELRQSHQLRPAFWEQCLEALRNSDCRLYDNISPSKDHWLAAGSGVSGVLYNLIFGKGQVRVELSLQRSRADENQFIYDQLEAEREALEEAFGDLLVWRSLPERKACRIQYACSVDGFNQDNWPWMIDWLVMHAQRLEQTMSDPLKRAADSLRKQGASKAGP